MTPPGLLRGDARRLPLADASVDLIVTSPPYFGLRSYTDGGERYDGQVGAEATPREFIAALIECTREMVRVLKPSGSIFLNLGDKYNSASSGQNGTATTGMSGGRHDRMGGRGATVHGVPQKSLMMLPERYRIAAVDELGLIARAVLVWSKPNGLPESVTDRVRRSHEDWVHLTKAPRYFASVDEIREPHKEMSRPGLMTWAQRKERGEPTAGGQSGGHSFGAGFTRNPLGKLPGSVWTVPTQPLRVPAELGIDHFAAFPMEWPRRLITGWCPREVCSGCGEGRRPVVDRSERTLHRPGGAAHIGTRFEGKGPGAVRTRVGDAHTVHQITGYACDCPDTSAAATRGVVLDPFGGTGTTALVAAALGYRGISLDLSADYGRLAQWRASDPGQRAKAAGLPDRPQRRRSAPTDPTLY